MVNKSMIVFGPPGSGKTRNAQALKKYFGLNRIVDDANFEELQRYRTFKTEGVLYLTNVPVVNLKPEEMRRVLNIEDAIKLLDLHKGEEK